MSGTDSCPACGTQLSEAALAEGLCPACQTAVTEEYGDGTLLTLPRTVGFLSAGETLGNRYRIRSQLGRGGMGEVWRAFDLKLRVDVAVKALREELLGHEQAVETLRQEVRVAREVISPNVCRVFDLLEVDGRELVSMEYIDGTTLAEILSARSPLELQETRERVDVTAEALEDHRVLTGRDHPLGRRVRDEGPELSLERSRVDVGQVEDRGDQRRGLVGVIFEILR